MNDVAIGMNSLQFTELSDAELAEIDGGNPVVAIAVAAYLTLTTTMINHPEDFTWMMDWYYQNNYAPQYAGAFANCVDMG